MRYLSFFILATLVSLSCKTKQTVINIPETEYRELDTMVVVAPKEIPEAELFDLQKQDYTLERYNPSHKREHDLLHTKLDLRFDWVNEKVLGKATLTLKPYFYEMNKLVLDAKNFEFHKVAFEGQSNDLRYEYDGKQIVIDLGKKYTKDEKFTLFIDYTASPTQSGGSDAITSDKGLFFINPRGEEGDKPQQIWTQGETENNSRWFPTIDKPNERTTQEMYLTVKDEFETLSNGNLISSISNGDGTRTDYWKMDLPHAPYLFMIAIGDFAIVKDDWKGMPVDYYVEHEFKDYARDIFPYTPEMLELFSKKLGMKYPWQKYAQVVVRDYVSGAMENTTAVIFGEFMQGTDRELLDNLTNEKIVAHEMFHHWFGDLVTCESWANLTMNEGFANYSEYIWLEEKYGTDEADYHRLNELNGYLSSARNGIHDLIDFNYEDKENMFDAHSYNKGGLVLHALRNYVGEEAFWTALNQYLSKNAYTEVEAHELRLAFEDVTGEDLNWFFNQWYFNQGHPELNVTYDYDAIDKKVNVTVEQTQDPTTMPPVFELPTAVDIYDENGKVQRHHIRVNKRTQTFSFDAPKQPKLVNFDADRILLGVMQNNKTEAEYIFQYRNASKLLDRFEALDALTNSENPEAKAVLKEALKDPFYALRGFAISYTDIHEPKVVQQIAQLAKTDKHSEVRGAALSKLAETEDKKHIDVAKYVIDNEKAYNVVSTALQMLYHLDQKAGLEYAKKLEKEDNGAILNAVGEIYMAEADAKYMPFFEKNWNKVDGFSAIAFIDNYGKMAINENETVIMDVANKLKSVGINEGQSPWRKFAATKAINDLHAELYSRAKAEADAKLQSQLWEKDNLLIQMIEAIKAAENNDQLKTFYVNFPNPPARP